MLKKGSLNLSINAIVVLILAVTMLGLGLMFMQNMMGQSMGQLSDVADSIKDQMIEKIRSSNEKLAFDTNDFEIKRSQEKEYYYGVLNQLDEQKSFNIEFACDQAMDTTADVTSVKFDYITSTIPLEQNAVDVQKVIFKIDPQAKPTTYRCYVDITEEGAGTDDSSYAQKYFFVTVE
jgi:hypothetical protein